ncbi:hypothetical protein GEMRC1_010549 [Eukaryota sp. GEM-RC1]
MLEVLHHLVSNQGIPLILSEDDVMNLTTDVSTYPEAKTQLSQLISQNLSVVLLIDNSDPLSQSMLLQFPSLFKESFSFYARPYSSKSLINISLKKYGNSFKALDQDLTEISEYLKNVTYAQSLVSQQLDTVFSSPSYFFSLVDMWLKTFESKTAEISTELTRLESGLETISRASSYVEQMNKDAEEQKVLLKQKNIEADEALVEIQRSMEEANEQKKQAEILSRELAIEEQELSVKSVEIKTKFESVEPILQAAQEAVTCIRSDQLAEIRGLRQPPEPIYDVLEGVLRILGNSDAISWTSMKKFLAKPGMKESILCFDARKITPPMLKSVKILLSKKGKSFSHDVITRASQAAAPLASWVKANVSLLKF